MSDERIARPVSGEIMSGGTAGNGADARAAARHEDGPEDVIDADFETVEPGDRGARPLREQASAPAAPAPAGMDILRSGAGPAQGERRGGPMFWLFGLALVAGAFWISGGHALVARPDTGAAGTAAQPSPAQPLRIVNVVSRIERQGAASFLVVDGEVQNIAAETLPVPALSIRVRAGDGAVTGYFLGTNGRTVAPGGRYAFSGRLAAPKDGKGTVTVDFRREGEN